MEEKEVKEKMYTETEVRQLTEGLRSQNAMLMKHLQEFNMAGIFKRMDYLFKVIEVNNTHFPVDFVEKCAKEIMEIMTVPEEESKEEE